MKKTIFFLSILMFSVSANADIFADKCIIGNTDYEKATIIDYPISAPVHKYSIYKPNPYRKNKEERKFYILPEASDDEDKSWYFFFGNNK